MATKDKEIMISTADKIGALSKALEPLKAGNVSIRAICAWGAEGKANFLLVVDNCEKGLEALKKVGFTATANEVVLTTLPNRIGAMLEATKKLADAGVSIDHCYVSAAGPEAMAIFATKDNAKALKVLG